MKRTLCTAALIACTALSAACDFTIFEDVGSDPHPPSVQLLSLERYVAPVVTTTTTTQSAAPPPGRALSRAGGFTVSTGEEFYIRRSYTDAGGDIVAFKLRDLDNAKNNKDLTPGDQTYFSGTSGVQPLESIDPATKGVIDSAELIGLTGMFGTHRLELWAEDSHGSRSAKVAFVITLVEP